MDIIRSAALATLGAPSQQARLIQLLGPASGLVVERSLVGNYITALEMQGCSISVLRLDDELTELWDAPVNTPALRWGM